MARDRTFLDDVRWAVAVLAGFVLGWLVFDADESILIGAGVGVAIVVAARALLRYMRARRT